MNYLDLTIQEIHEALVNKKTTPLELTKEAIKRAKEDKNNAFEYIAEKEALDFASSLKEVEVDNLLWGIPYTCKDNISTKGIPTTASSDILKGYVPIFDATVIEKLKAKKAILIGKVTLDELAMGGSGSTGHLGKTLNPYDPKGEHQVGGSSAGSAATVAASIVPFSLGSDTGDSIRKPASYAGLVGIKPTWSRISRYGLFPFTNSLDAIGCFTRCVEDSAIVMEALSGKDSKDFTSSDNEVKPYLKNINSSIKGMKIAVIKEIVDSISNKEIVEQFNKTLEIYKSLGAIINFVSVDEKLLQTLFPTYYIISCAEATSNNANLDGIKFGPSMDGENYIEAIKKCRSECFSERIKRRFVIGSYSLMKENQNELYLRAKKNRHRIVDVINKIFTTNDAIYCPAAPNVAPLFNSSMDQLQNEYLIADNWMVIGNFAGLPSLTLPIGFKDNLPFGANISCKPFEEEKVFILSKALEDKLPYKNLSIRNKK